MKKLFAAFAFIAASAAAQSYIPTPNPGEPLRLPAAGGGSTSCTGTSGQILTANGTSSNCAGVTTGAGVLTLLGTFSTANLATALGSTPVYGGNNCGTGGQVPFMTSAGVVTCSTTFTFSAGAAGLTIIPNNNAAQTIAFAQFNGSSGFPAIYFGSAAQSSTNYAFLFDSSNGVILNDGAVGIINFRTSNTTRVEVLPTSLLAGSSVGIGFSPTASGQLTASDTAISRDSAGVFDFGNGTVGDKTAKLNFLGHSPGLTTTLTAATGAIVNSETQIVGLSIPANTLVAGSTFHIHAGCNTTTSTSPGNVTFRIRIGTSSLSGNITASVAAASNASVTTQPFTVDSWNTVRTNGATGSILGDISIKDDGAIATSAFANDIGSVTTATVVVDTTATKIIELTAITGAATASITCQNAAIELVKI